ncbi:MAG TPA: hypothetical protein VMF09_08865 [Solirubrobacteraceae bacterium]|nr:hypothetical protein [Solirubrobacteraceae bacterium]
MSAEQTLPRPYRRSLAPAALVCASALALSGCGASSAPQVTAPSDGSSSTSVPAYVEQPFSHEQQLVERGAHLIVTDGCSACHLGAGARREAPSFLSFAGHRVRLNDGRSVLVNERFMREGLLDPTANEIAGYDSAPMLAAVARLQLASHPAQLAALAAFIEQIGPETE